MSRGATGSPLTTETALVSCSALSPTQKEDYLTFLGLPSISDYKSAVILVSPPLESLCIGIHMGVTGA